MVANTSVGEQYSIPVAFVYVFNLIVGVGALNLPSGFEDAGLVLGILFLALNAFLAFITVTWLTEAQAVANAVLAFKEMGVDATESYRSAASIQTGVIPTQLDPFPAETDALIQKNIESTKSTNVFNISRRVEVGLMSELFLGQVGQKIFYLILVIYLYGDLSIYAVTIPTSLATVTHGWSIGHFKVSDYDVYYIYLAAFSLIVIPLSFFNFQKTKILQIFTLATRNFSLLTMIILSIVDIGEGEGVPAKSVPLFNIGGLPSIFGVSIYAFMCHHSLPGLLTPVKDKSRLNTLMGVDFIAIFVVYAGLCVSALFAFGSALQPLYTLNFAHYHVRPIGVILSLYPVFTLTTNFPLIAITLRNNLMLLIPYGENRPRLRQVVFSLVATLPPIGIAFATRNVQILVSITGSYAGLGIMFVMPALLVLYARRKIQKLSSDLGVNLKNEHASPFHGIGWIILLLVVSVLCVGLVTYKRIYDAIIDHRHH